MGPPGCKRNDYANSIAEYFQWEFIQTGEALKQEAKKSTATAERIKKALANFESIDDDIVVDIISKKI